MVEKVVSCIGSITGEHADKDSRIIATPGWDSLTHISIICSLEEAFGVEFSVDELEVMDSVQSICEVLSQRTTEIK